MNLGPLLLALAAVWGTPGPSDVEGPRFVPAEAALATETAEAPSGQNPAADRPAPDRWIGEDKVQHFAASFAATGMAYGGGRLVMDAPAARGSAVALALALGIGKELADVRRGRPFSFKDLAWDAAGVTLGVIFAHRIH